MPYWFELPTGDLINLCLVRHARWVIPLPSDGTRAGAAVVLITMAYTQENGRPVKYETSGDAGQRLIDLIQRHVVM